MFRTTLCLLYILLRVVFVSDLHTTHGEIEGKGGAFVVENKLKKQPLTILQRRVGQSVSGRNMFI